MTLHDHLLVSQLLSHILGRGAGHLDPCLGEQSACRQDERQIEDGMERIGQDLVEVRRRRHVVGQPANWDRLAMLRPFILL